MLSQSRMLVHEVGSRAQGCPPGQSDESLLKTSTTTAASIPAGHAMTATRSRRVLGDNAMSSTVRAGVTSDGVYKMQLASSASE